MLTSTRTDRSQLVETYLHYREVMRELVSAVRPYLPEDALLRGGRHLGLLRRGILVFDSEEEMAVLMDYCYHSIRFEGRNAVQRYLSDCPPTPGADASLLLPAFAEARFSIYQVQRVERGLGVEIANVFAEDRQFMVDMGFSKSGTENRVFAGRMLRLPDFCMGTGAMVPIRDQRTLIAIDRRLSEEFQGRMNWAALTPKQQTVFESIVLRSSLMAGEIRGVRYAEARESMAASSSIPYR